MALTSIRTEYRIESIEVQAYTTPTQTPESDGTLEWDATTLVYVEVQTGGQTGIGYTYAHVATAKLIESMLRKDLMAKMRCRLARVGRLDRGVRLRAL